MAKVTLANERVSLSSSGSLWGTGPSAADLLRLVREAGGLSDPNDRQRAASLHIEAEVLRLNRLRTLTARLQGRTPGAEASIQKIMGDEHGQHVMQFAKQIAGSDGMLAGSGRRARCPPRTIGPDREQLPERHRAPVSGRRPGVALRLPVRAGADRRRWHVRGAARRRGRAGARAPTREIDVEHGLAWAETRQRPN